MVVVVVIDVAVVDCFCGSCCSCCFVVDVVAVVSYVSVLVLWL